MPNMAADAESIPTHMGPPLDTHPARQPHKYRLAVLFLLWVALVARLINFGSESLWYDETFSAYLAAQPAADLIAHTARDIHPPGYYLLLRLWLLLTSPTVGYGFEYLLAWPSLAASLLVLAVGYALTRRLAGEKAALFTLLLGAVHPTHLWFAQEVRMYAPAALFMLLALWATMRLVPTAPRQNRLWLVYAGSALLSLYTLYYSAFWLFALNLSFAWRWWWATGVSSTDKARFLWRWLMTQGLVVLGFSPWLPTLVRQALQPPVPPWRPDLHDLSGIVAAMLEAFTALIVGHVQQGLGCLLVVLGVGLLVWSIYCYAKFYPEHNEFIPATFVGLPLILLIGLSAWGSNLYHVRYTALSAAAFPIVIATFLARPSIPRPLTLLLAASLLILQWRAVYQLNTDPAYRADDHRAAVRLLADQWRPGDAILVNAGWAYTALAVYWTDTPLAPDQARPAQPAGFPRLSPDFVLPPGPLSQPLIYRSGSINGNASLGWGLPESDFFAVGATATEEALAQIAQNYRRIWHYRIYDTVSDPQAHIRRWLADNAVRSFALPIPGADYLLLERYDFPVFSHVVVTSSSDLMFDDFLSLHEWSAPATINAGETLYLHLTWTKTVASDVKTSLRLVNTAGQIIAQADEPILPSPGASSGQQTLALGIPLATPPTPHRLVLIVYDGATLRPYAAPDGAESTELGIVSVMPPLLSIPQRTRLARFDYLDLESVTPATLTLQPGDVFDFRMIWRANHAPYRDDYAISFRLTPQTARAGVFSLDLDTTPLGPPSYPSGAWLFETPVARVHTLRLPPETPPGIYALEVGLLRTADRAVIPRAGWVLPIERTNVRVATLHVLPR